MSKPETFGMTLVESIIILCGRLPDLAKKMAD